MPAPPGNSGEEYGVGGIQVDHGRKPSRVMSEYNICPKFSRISSSLGYLLCDSNLESQHGQHHDSWRRVRSCFSCPSMLTLPLTELQVLLA